METLYLSGFHWLKQAFLNLNFNTTKQLKLTGKLHVTCYDFKLYFTIKNKIANSEGLGK